MLSKLLGVKFSRTFWLVNVLELCERGAYYGMLAALPYHLVYNLGFSAAAFGIILAIITPFLYFLPIISGALAEKYGYRNMLILAFILLITGYVASSFMTSFLSFVLAFSVMGIGAGIFKPIISASIARTTMPNNRNLGYSIYYWMINLGAFLAPLFISLTIPKELYGNAFYIAAALIGFNLFVALFLLSEIHKSDVEKKALEAIAGLSVIFKDKKFLILIVIYAGFWFMYSINHLALLVYMVDFRIVGDWFPPAMVAIVNPGTIIIGGLFLGKLVEKVESLVAMIMGICTFIVGLILLGMTLNPILFFIGIVIFSCGEFITHPTFISYVSKIAPKDKVSVYMGYAFLPTFIGLTSGNFIGGILYSLFAESMHRPKIFWASIISVGLLTVALLVIYNKKMGIEPIKMGKVDRIIRSGAIPVAAIVFIPCVFGAALSMGEDKFYRFEKEEEIIEGKFIHETVKMSDWIQEGTSIEKNITIDGEGRYLNITLTWKDEDDINYVLRRYENSPDTFRLTVIFPSQNEISVDGKNEHGKEGVLIININSSEMEPGEYKIIIECMNAGDYEGRFGITSITDEGNRCELKIDYEYVAE